MCTGRTAGGIRSIPRQIPSGQQIGRRCRQISRHRPPPGEGSPPRGADMPAARAENGFQHAHAAETARTRSGEQSRPSPGPRPREPRRQRSCGCACLLPRAAAALRPPSTANCDFGNSKRTKILKSRANCNRCMICHTFSNYNAVCRWGRGQEITIN